MPWTRPLRPALIALLALASALLMTLTGVIGAAPAHAAVAAADLGGGTNTADLGAYATATVTPANDALLLLSVTSGRTDGKAAAPTSVSGLGLTWTQVATTRNKAGTLAAAVFSAPAPAGTAAGAVSVGYAGVQQNFTWQVVATGSSQDTVVQSATAIASATSITATLPVAPRSGDGVFAFASAASTTQTSTPGSGFAAVGAVQTSTAPAVRTAAEWRPDAVAKPAFGASGTASKTLIAVEVSDGPYTPPYVAGPTVAVIGDSLTYQGGQGAAQIGSRLAAIGYDAAHVYFHAVGGKAMAKADSTGTTTVQNIAEARATLGHVDTWVIALGTNDVSSTDATFNANQNAILEAIGPADRVVWVGLAFYRVTNTRAARFNALIDSGVRSRSTVRYADWNAYVHNGRDETGLWVYPTDSTHMTDAGYALRNDYYVAQVPAVSAPPAAGRLTPSPTGTAAPRAA